MQDRSDRGWSLAAVEQYARHYVEDVDFTISARVDRIERRPDGYAVFDYKTGTPPSIEMLKVGFDVQLPLTAVMVENGAFKDLPKGDVRTLAYVKVRGLGDGVKEEARTSPDHKKGLTSEEYAANALETFMALVKAFDDPNTAYHSQPRIQYTHDYGAYDDLARRAEWQQLGNDGGSHER